jgi:hypothetical protein
MVPAAVYAGALAVLTVLFGFNSCALDKAKTNLATARANLVTCVSVNERNKDAIDTVKLINEQCIADRQVDETKQANAVAAWVVERELLQVEASERHILEVEVYRNPSCAELAQTDINAICPELANSLRRRTDGNN